MKIKTITILAVSAIAAVAGAQGHRMPMKHMMMSKKTDWNAMYRGAAKMFEARNAAGIVSYMAPDCKMIMNGQTMNKEQGEASLQKWFGMMSNLHCKFSNIHVMEKGGMANTSDTFHMWGMMKDPKGKMHTITLEAGKQFHTHKGILEHDSLLGGPEGVVVRIGKMHKYDDRGMETMRWARMNGKWMMKSIKSSGEKMTLDGKPFDPSKMGG